VIADKQLARRKLSIAMVSPTFLAVREVLEVAGLSDIFRFFDSKETARGAGSALHERLGRRLLGRKRQTPFTANSPPGRWHGRLTCRGLGRLHASASAVAEGVAVTVQGGPAPEVGIENLRT
jgi:hypothetical protein